VGSVLAYLLWHGGMEFRTIFIGVEVVAFFAPISLVPIRESLKSTVGRLRPHLFGFSLISPV